MRKLGLIFILCLFFSSSCSNRDIIESNYNLKGENNLWIIEYNGYSKGEFYKENGVLKYKEDSDGKFTLTYKGELSELSKVREIGYKFRNGGGKITSVQAPEKKVFTWNHSLSAVSTEEDNKTVDIIIDGNIDSIELKNLK